METPENFLEKVVKRLETERELALAPLGSFDLASERKKVNTHYNRRIRKFTNQFSRYKQTMGGNDNELSLRSSNERNGLLKDNFPGFFEKLKWIQLVLSYTGLAGTSASDDLQNEMAQELYNRNMTEEHYKIYSAGKRNPEVDPASIQANIRVVSPRKEERISRSIFDLEGVSTRLPSQVDPQFRRTDEEEDYSEISDP